MTVLGIDTSHHNPLPDFAALKRGGIGFAFPKATEGVGFVDPQYAASRAGAHAAGLLVGPYHFARPGDPVAQADFFLEHATPRPGELTELDLEDQAIPDPVGFSKAWCERVHAKTGAWPLLYLNSWFLTSYDWRPVLADGDGLWLAKYDGQPTGGPTGVWPVIAVKQFTDRATVPGQPGQVDEDAFAGDLTALARYAIPGAPTPAPPQQEEDDMTGPQAAQLQAVNDAVAAIRVAVADPTGGILKRVAVMQGQITALTAAVAALPGGGTVDAAAIEAAAHQGAHDALTALGAAIAATPA